MKKRIILISSILLIAVLVAFTLVKNKKAINASNKVVDRSAIPIPVSVIAASDQSVNASFTLPAIVQPEEQADISINATGKLKSLNIDLGTQVTKGEVIGSIDNSVKELNLASTQLLLDKYKVDYQKYKELYAGKAATESDYNNAKYNYENTQVQLAQIKQQIADGLVVAPVSGTIVKKNFNAGEFVNTGAKIAAVVNVSKLKANVMVSEREVYRLKKGTPVNITCDIYPGQTFKGMIRYISPEGDESHNYLVELSIENSGSTILKAGTFTRSTFDLQDNANVLQIPKTALVEGIDNPYIYVINGNHADTRKLVLGHEIGDNIEVLSGLNIGEQVITEGQINISQGSLIQVVNTK
jgi:membrane fusion protein (multidrug efflux system)